MDRVCFDCNKSRKASNGKGFRAWSFTAKVLQ